MTPERIEEFRREWNSPPQPGDEPWVAESHAALHAVCDLALDGLRLRQGKVLVEPQAKNWVAPNVGENLYLRKGHSIVLVDKKAKP